MGRVAFCLPLALLFLATVIPTKAQGDAVADGAQELLYDVRGNITLLCDLPNNSSLDYVWKVNDTALEQAETLKGRYQLERAGAELRVARSLEDDFGNYSCALAGGGAERRWSVRGRPHVKLPPNTNVVEDQALKIVCKVIGKPYVAVTWGYTADPEGSNFTDAAKALGARVSFNDSDAGVPGAVLALAAAQRGDAGRYQCRAGDATDETVLRVKDMYAALWPFLGICAEVFVLCAIILVYEKRRTKPELDDSDTDNHDQKKS